MPGVIKTFALSFEPTGLIVISYHHHIITLNMNASVWMFYWWEYVQVIELHNITYESPWIAITREVAKKKRERTRFLLLLSDFFCSLSNLTITSPLFYRCLTMSELMVMNMYIHTYISLCIYLCVCIEALSW